MNDDEIAYFTVCWKNYTYDQLTSEDAAMAYTTPLYFLIFFSDVYKIITYSKKSQRKH